MKSYGNSFTLVFSNRLFPNFVNPLVKLCLILALLLLFPLSQVLAADIEVDADCELTEAIQNANDDAATNSDCEAGSGTDTITITQEGTTNGTITLSSTLTISSNIIIEAGGFTISGNNAVRVLFVGGGSNLTLNNVTITEGRTSRNNGGGIYNNGTLTITNSTIRDNRSTGRSIGQGRGSGIYNNHNGTLTITNSTISDNEADYDGGGIYAHSTFTLTHVTMVNNKAGNLGDGLYFSGVNTSNKKIRNSILANNGDSDCYGYSNRVPTENVGNLIESGNCGGDVLTADPLLGSLTGSPGYYPLLAGSPAINAASSEHCLPEDQRGEPRLRTACDIGAYGVPVPVVEPPPVVEEEDGEDDACLGCPPSKQPFVRTTIALLPEIEVSDLTGFTEAQRIDADGVGIQSVIDRGIVDAVDVWGFMGAGTRVCFLASGSSFSFLNASTSPRTVSSLPLYVIEGKTCTFIDGPGSVVLHPGAAPEGAVASNGPARALSNCMVTTNYMLNFRDGPGGEVIGGLPYDVTLTALSRTAGWFEVDYHGATGWISAEYVTPNGDCG